MIFDMAVYLPAVAAATALLLCFYADKIGGAFGLLDVPDGRKVHATVTPLLGGIVLLLAFFPAALISLSKPLSLLEIRQLVVWLCCTAGVTLVGLADDKHSLSPRLRLLLSFLIFGGAAAFEPAFLVRVLNFEHPPFGFGLGTWSVALLFTVVCCVGLMNAVNMADGKNGLVIGLCMGWLGLLAMRAQPHFLVMIVLLLATLAVLLAFNLRGRLFLGDGGAYGLASAIGMLSIATYNTPGNHSARAISADELMLLFIVPVIDSFRLTFMRLRRGQSPMAADRDHLHHILLDRFGWPGGLFIYWFVALGLAAGVIFWA
jgi:UDP-GlcNAc:undecaprenyl-phosphate/decaprenyl-phosphate GlcNAc-1-phosphate transferase